MRTRRPVFIVLLMLSLGCSIFSGVGAPARPTDVPQSATAVPTSLAPATAPDPTSIAVPATQTETVPTPTAMAADAVQGPAIGGCPVFPTDHVWNRRVDSLPVDPNSDSYIKSIGAGTSLHPDFGSALYDGGPIGIPFTTAGPDTPPAQVTFDYADESDKGPYPIPVDAPIEGGPSASGDRHILIVETSKCRLYELYAAYPNGDGTWHAGSGAIWDLRAYALRPLTWTSADAAGLPILPGLARYDEVAAGAIRHALRFTAVHTRDAFIWPARHQASDETSTDLPPMGQRFRLKASVDITGFPTQSQVLLRAMQQYGLILADNGSNWYISGAPDPGWNDDQLVSSFRKLTGNDFEAVDESSLMVQADSGQTK